MYFANVSWNWRQADLTLSHRHRRRTHKGNIRNAVMCLSVVLRKLNLSASRTKHSTLASMNSSAISLIPLLCLCLVIFVTFYLKCSLNRLHFSQILFFSESFIYFSLYKIYSRNYWVHRHTHTYDSQPLCSTLRRTFHVWNDDIWRQSIAFAPMTSMRTGSFITPFVSCTQLHNYPFVWRKHRRRMFIFPRLCLLSFIILDVKKICSTTRSNTFSFCETVRCETIKWVRRLSWMFTARHT